MKRALFVILAASLLLISGRVQAEVLNFSCVEPDDPSGAELVRVDTKTHVVILTDPGEQPIRGIAQVNGTTIVVGGFPAVGGRAAGSWSMTINRSTGASIDSDGSSGTCRLVR